MALWGGRFDAESDPLFRAFNDSLPFDARLVAEDLRGSVAWARGLVAAGALGPDEADRIVAALGEVAAEAARDPSAIATAGDEDVHSWVERKLVERTGDLGKRLHTGRSRNDQVATDLRLWTRSAIDARIDELRDAQRALVALGRREQATVLPGYTHLQRAQPVLFAHWCLAYAEMLDRDAGRFADARRRLDRCPLGSAALAGTAWPVDRAAIAADLGFAGGPTGNSLDAVSDRDFVVETLAASALAAVHLSRLAEDLIFYGTGEAAFVAFDDSFTSGSSLMPQKKNPDGLELIRGKSGRIVGGLVGLLVVLKGLPLAYDKDLQEDKEPLFDAMDALSMSLRGLVVILGGTTVDRARTEAAARGGHANATELADYLAERGVPFRTAHEIVGRVVRRAIDDRAALEELPLEVLRTFSDVIGEDVYDRLALATLLARRDVEGGTAPRRVAAALDRWEARLSSA